MSFTPRGEDGRPKGTNCPRFPRHPACCMKDRRCAACPFPVQLTHPPWFTCPPACPIVRKPLIKRAKLTSDLTYNVRDYVNPEQEDLVAPIMAFWHYCDHVPDPVCSCKPAAERDPGLGPWPPLAQAVCPPPRECLDCGVGPWADPHTRRFFYTDCA